jgi:hypothetical protein
LLRFTFVLLSVAARMVRAVQVVVLGPALALPPVAPGGATVVLMLLVLRVSPRP